MADRNLTRDDAFDPANLCNLDICPLDWTLYGYIPSLAANITFIVLFAMVGIIHGYLGYCWKSWGFMGGMLAGSAAEILGYAGRIILHDNPFSYEGFLIQIVCLTFAPVFYTASIYITLSKTIEHLDPTISRIRPKFFYWFFIPFDLVCLILQALGGGMSAGSDSGNTGVDISMAGLVLQVIVLLLFIAVFLDYLVRYCRINKTTRFSWRLKTFLIGLSVAVLLILTRCVYRVAELRDGYDGELFREEVPFIILEGVAIVLAAFSLCFGHPGLLIKAEGGRRVFGREKGNPASGSSDSN